MYPDIYFIGVDQTQETSLPFPSNLVNQTFPEDAAGYMVGALAAAVSENYSIGAVCSTYTLPAIWRYCEGYRAGAAYADSKLNNQTRVSVIYHKDTALAKTLSDPGWGTEMADSLIAQGVDVIFGVGGTTSTAGLVESATKGVYVVDVDVDQYYTVPEAASMMLSSAVKLVAPGMADLIAKAREAQNGDFAFPAGNYLCPVSFAPYHDMDGKISANVKNLMHDPTTGLLDGTIGTSIPLTKP